MKRLTFTFDNGPAPGATEKILDFLAARAIKTTFFVTGERLRDPAARKLAERAHAEGHWIGNHTFSHGEPLGIDGSHARVEREIGETQRLLGDLAHPRHFFRPNGKGRLGPHLLSQEALAYLIAHHYTLVTWNNVPRDWEAPRTAWVQRAFAALSETNWSLLVLHDEHVGGMMETLIEFHDRVMQMGTEITQNFPLACVPLRQGKIAGPIDDFVAAGDAATTTLAEATHA